MIKGHCRAERKPVDCDVGPVLRLRRFIEMDTLLSCGRDTDSWRSVGLGSGPKREGRHIT